MRKRLYGGKPLSRPESEDCAPPSPVWQQPVSYPSHGVSFKFGGCLSIIVKFSVNCVSVTETLIAAESEQELLLLLIVVVGILFRLIRFFFCLFSLSLIDICFNICYSECFSLVFLVLGALRSAAVRFPNKNQ